MFCQNCGKRISGKGCPYCGYINLSSPNDRVVLYQVNRKPSSTSSGCLVTLVILPIIVITIAMFFMANSKDDKEEKELYDSFSIETESVENVEIPEDSYESNDYYEIVETAEYEDEYYNTHIIHKIRGKKTATVTGKIRMYSDQNKVMGDYSSTINIKADEYNYFDYQYYKNDNEYKMKMTAEVNSKTLPDDEYNAVKMVDYNISDNLFITFEQVGEIDSFSQFKLIFYKDDKIVSTRSGYFNIEARYLEGVGTTDVVEISIGKLDFDRIEYIYEQPSFGF